LCGKSAWSISFSDLCLMYSMSHGYKLIILFSLQNSMKRSRRRTSPKPYNRPKQSTQDGVSQEKPQVVQPSMAAPTQAGASQEKVFSVAARFLFNCTVT
jgi:hypothetical protein